MLYDLNIKGLEFCGFLISGKHQVLMAKKKKGTNGKR